MKVMPGTHEEMIQRDMMNLKDNEPLDLQLSISAKGGEIRKHSTYDVAEIFSPLGSRRGPEQGASREDGAWTTRSNAL